MNWRQWIKVKPSTEDFGVEGKVLTCFNHGTGHESFEFDSLPLQEGYTEPTTVWIPLKELI